MGRSAVATPWTEVAMANILSPWLLSTRSNATGKRP